LTVAAVAIAAITITGLQSCSPPGDEAVREAVPVETFEVIRGELEQTVQLTGDIIAGRSVRLFGQIPDRLTGVMVDVGDPVSRGQVLARIRDEGVRAGVDQIEANLRAASVTLANLRDEYNRTERLYEAGAVSSQSLESLKTRLEAAEAQQEQLQAGLSAAQASSRNAAITAPFDGVVAERYMEAGDLAGPGFPVFRVVNMSTVRVISEISQERLGQIQLDMPARVQVSSYPGVVFEGTVINIAPVLDPMTRMTKIEVGLDNSDGRLKAGMFARVDLVVRTIEDGLLIPIDALLEEYRYLTNASLISAGGDAVDPSLLEANVYVAENETAHSRTVRLGLVGTEMLQILEGLEAGEQVITVGKYQISDGAPIFIRTFDREGGER
jgi:membrane fusion protein (multidrug efflux system)